MNGEFLSTCAEIIGYLEFKLSFLKKLGFWAANKIYENLCFTT